MDEYEALIIEVTGINTNTSKDTLENYFSSSRRGGDIANVEYIRGSGNASITFADAEDAKKALETSPHSLEESALTLTRRKKVEISENDKVFVEGISKKTTEDCLKFYMERLSGSDVKDIKYAHAKSSESVNAIVTFHSPIDFDKIQTDFKKKPTLEGKHISIKTVPLCKTILVKNLPATATDDSVSLSFESKRAGGGDVARVDLDLEKKIALVEFEDPNVIDKVLSVTYKLDNTILSVERCHPILSRLADLQLKEQETSNPIRRRTPTPKPRQRKSRCFTEDIDRKVEPTDPMIEELSKSETRKEIKSKMCCKEHSGMELKVYCETCDQLICRDCMDFKHVKQGHSCVLVKDVANSYKELLASNSKAMEDAITEGNAFVQRLTLTTEELDRDAENIKTEIAQRKEFVAKKVVQSVVEMLDQKAETLLKKVDEIHKGKRTNLDRQAEETKLYVENIKTSVQLSKKLVDQGTEEEIISSQKMMLDNANNLLKNRKEYPKAPIPVAKLSYISSTAKDPIDEEILSGLANSLGHVSEGNKGRGQDGNEKRAKTIFLDDIPTTPRTVNQSSVILSPAIDQPEQTKQLDESFTISLLILRYIMAYHYEVFQKLESVCKEISFSEVKSKDERNLKLTPREDVDPNKFSKAVDTFIDSYQTQSEKMFMVMENIAKLPKRTFDHGVLGRL